jgi:hypothetical protein
LVPGAGGGRCRYGRCNRRLTARVRG